MQEDEVIGVGGFKGPPQNNTLEIAYGVAPEKERQGFGSQICQELTKIAINEDLQLRITARTLMEENASTKILKKNGFKFMGIVNDLEDGDVWEWELMNGK